MKIAIGCDPNAQTAKEEIIKFIVKKCLVFHLLINSTF